jgi:hypothetical protein
MKREIIVNASMTQTRVAVLEDGHLVELMIDDVKARSIAGNIYKGRVVTLNLETVTLTNGDTVELEIIRHPGAPAACRYCRISTTVRSSFNGTMAAAPG